MKILVIDDLRTFKPEVLEANPSWVVTYARTSAEAKSILEKTGLDYFNAIYFDHDLGIANDEVDSAIKIAEVFEELWYDDTPYDAAMFVHSSNPVGAKRLMDILRQYNPSRIHADSMFYTTTEMQDKVLGSVEQYGMRLAVIPSEKA